jgi:hypothetical protein
LWDNSANIEDFIFKCLDIYKFDILNFSFKKFSAPKMVDRASAQFSLHFPNARFSKRHRRPQPKRKQAPDHGATPSPTTTRATSQRFPSARRDARSEALG